MRHWFIAPGLALLATPLCEGAYSIVATSQGQGSRLLVPGQEFVLDVGLIRDGGEVHNSCIFRLVFSGSGLEYLSYTWSAPYTSLFDDSSPALAALPAALDPELLIGPGYPSEIADIELSNVVPGGSFAEGTLVSLLLRVPADYAGPGTIFIGVEPDTFAQGFDEIQVTPASPFVLTVPSPGAGSMGLLLLLTTRRRRLYA